MTPPDLGLEPITAVHDADFVEFLARATRHGSPKDIWSTPASPTSFRTSSPPGRSPAGIVAGRRPATIRAELGLYAMDTMTLISEGTFDAACSAVHAAAHAADLVVGGAAAAYAAVRPPGHHVGPAFFGGACYLNNAAAAAQRLRAAGIERVAIVDIDAHQGNGTQEIFWDRADVLYASVHVDPGAGWFPHLVGFADECGGGDGAGLEPSTCRCPPAPATRPGSPALQQLLAAVDRHRSEAWWSRSVWTPRRPIRLPAGGHRRRVPAAGRCSPSSACRRCSCRRAATSSTSSPPWCSTC